jgi:hypothetical protein
MGPIVTPSISVSTLTSSVVPLLPQLPGERGYRASAVPLNPQILSECRPVEGSLASPSASVSTALFLFGSAPFCNVVAYSPDLPTPHNSRQGLHGVEQELHQDLSGAVHLPPSCIPTSSPDLPTPQHMHTRMIFKFFFLARVVYSYFIFLVSLVGS